MFKKINIKIFKIPEIYNTGFIVDYKNNHIINIESNYTLPLPFKTTLINTLYLFELLAGPGYLILSLILNTIVCNSLICKPDISGYKKELFNILNNRPKPQQSFKKINNILNILESKSYKFNSHNIIKINTNKFIDLSTENIKSKEHIISSYRPNIFMIIGNSINLNSEYDYCIIDDVSNLIPEITIDSNNCDDICIEDLYNFNNIHITKSFFFSKKYSYEYSKYHSNYKSRYAYNNYKKHFNTLSDEEHCFNIELINNKIFIFKNISVKKLIHHPILHSNNIIMIMNNTVKESDIVDLGLLFREKNNYEMNINFKESLYLDPYKFFIYKLYLNLTEIDHNSFEIVIKNLCKTNNSIMFIYKYNIDDFCINNEEVEIYKYDDELLIENIQCSTIIIDANITLYNLINVIGGEEIYNLKNIYKLS